MYPDKSFEHPLSLTPSKESQNLLKLSQTTATFPQTYCIHQLFEKQVEQTPNAIAITFQSQQLTYQQLNQQANQLAHYLQQIGIGQESLVGICVERSIEMIVGLLGILKTGGMYVPLDPTYPKERLAFMLQDAQPSLVLSQSHLVESLPAAEITVLQLDTDWPTIAHQPSTNLDSHCESTNPAYVIYTSGSTGKPKGVLGTHIGAINRFHWMWTTYPFASDEVCCQKTTLSFIDSVWEIFGPLLQGLPLVIIPDNAVKDTSRLVQALAEYKISRIVLVPSLLQVILDSFDDLQQRLPHLKYWTTSGEALSVALCRKFQATLPQAMLLNIYGSSEVAADVTCFEVGQRQMQDTVPIGKPISNMQIYILGPNLEPVPLGTVGELYVGGVGLAKGYLNRPDLTEERFIASPFSSDSEARLFKTGDLARYQADDNIEFLGRVDHQVKIRGIRIELGEIETVLGQHPQVDNLIVHAWDAADGQKQLIAYVVLSSEATATDSDLRKFVGHYLPEHMVPAAFVRLDSFPLTPNGKIARHALPQPKRIRPLLSEAFAPPQSLLEEEITAIWAEILGFAEIGRNDNFFDLGGHSLLAGQLVTHLSQKFKGELSFQTLFELPTVAALANYMSQAKTSSQVNAWPVEPIDRNQTLPLSFGQEQLWFVSQLEPDSPAYNVPLAIKIAGSLDISFLRKSLQQVVQRHEILRTRFELADDRAIQVVEPTLEIPLLLVDVSTTCGTQSDCELTDLIQQEVSRPFDLAQAPLFRTCLFQINSQEQVLLLVFHHIISDDWSLRLFMQELWHLYEAHVRGVPSTLPDITIQYVDFAAWQQKWMTASWLNPQLTYWTNQLADLPPILELPTDRPRRANRTRQAGAEVSHLGPALVGSLQTLSRQSEVTLFITLLTAFQALLYRYTSQEDIVVGTPITNRPDPKFENIIGYFVNTLVLRLDLTGNPTFQQLLARAREMVLGAFNHRDLPFDRLVQALQPERALSHNPLFQVMFAYQNEPSVNDLKPTGLNLNAYQVNTGTAMFDLVLFLEETPQGINVVWDYDADLFDAATIRRLASHFEQLVTGLATNPAQPVLQLPLLAEVERQQILVDWNQTATPFPDEQTLPQLFEAQVARTPSAVAVVHGHQTLNYDTLNRKANQLAHYLRRYEVGPDVLVGISLERSPELIIAMLAVWKAGGAYVPLDPSYPSDRLHFKIDNANVSILLTQEKLVDKFPHQTRQVICLDTDWPTIASELESNPNNNTQLDNLAYVIYTSGSTGRPKGAMIEQRGVSNLAQAQIKAFDIQADSRVLQFASFSFDAAVSEVVMALLPGATLYLADQYQLIPGLELVKLLQDHEISVVTLPPSVLAILSPEQFPHLRTVVSAGEACSANIAARWSPGRRFLNAYGPAECTVCATIADHVDGRRKPSIGKPIDNVQIYILNDALEPTPIGVVGEIYIGGVGVGRGYLNRPALTAQRFIDIDNLPFESDSDDIKTAPINGKGHKLYRTGDLASYRPDGAIEYLGRVDYQVKLRGFRIELEEIEAILKLHPSIQDGIVAVTEMQHNKQLVGYITSPDDQPPSTSDLHNFLRQKLPDYMLPSIFVPLDRLPLTPNGKVDRQALPAPDHVRSELAAAYVAPSSTTEKIIADILADILRLDQVGVHDNFFELGGDSLLVVQVITRLEKSFKADLGMRVLFENPTVAGLAKQIENRPSHQSTPPLKPIPRGQSLPLAFAQERLWFLEQLEAQNAAYNVHLAFRLTGHLNFTALEWSLAQIVARHESLRTRFLKSGGHPIQKIDVTATPRLELVDLAYLPEKQRETELLELAQVEVLTPFNLTDDSLIRLKLLRLEAEAHLLLITMHHIISDEWSMALFVKELSELYRSFIDNEPAHLPELTVQFADYAHWQRERLQDALLEPHLSYWRTKLADLPLLQLPTDHSRPAVQRYQGATETILLPVELLQSLQDLGRQAETTPFMTLLAAFQTLLYRYSGQEDIVVGTPIVNRGQADLEHLIGFFVNTLVLRVDFSGQPTFNELLKRVREVSLAAYSQQEMPFERLVEELQPERDLSRNPLFQVMFVFQSQDVKLELPGLQVEAVELPTETAKFDLTLFVEETPAGLKCLLEYNTDLFEAATIQRMLTHFATLLNSVVTKPHLPLADQSLLTEAERHQMLVDWNDTQAELPAICVHQLIEAQVERTPEAIALTDVGTGQTLTYLELNQQANQLAHYLREQGVGPEVLVGLYLTCRPEMIIGILGVLKAGGAYVPLSPDLPPERLAFQLEDAQVKLILTETALTNSLPDTTPPVFYLDGGLAQLVDYPTHNQISDVSPDNLIYVIYTSGSTGQPKGVLLDHRGVVNYLTWAAQTYAVAQGQGVPLHSSFAFDMTVTSIFAPLLTGQTIHLLPDEAGVEGLGQFMRHQRDCSLVKVTPTHLELLSRQLADIDVSNLTRYFILGGENLLTKQIAFWREHAPETIIVNEYGPTETVVGCCVYMTPPGELNSASVPIGRPIANTQLYILDKNLQPVPVGVPGELYIGGAGVARGYLNRPELTKERFISLGDVPFAIDDTDAIQPEKINRRLYKTGDLARYRPDRVIEYLGRLDHQVKLRGYRVELEEIESILRQHPAVQEAVTLTQDSNRLVAYLVVKPEATPTTAELRDFLRPKLPDYMTPASFIMLDAIPQASSGKVDRRALLATVADGTELERAFAPARNAVEEKLINIWENLLDIRPIGVTDNFFELGGHSLLAVRLLTQIEEEFGFTLPLITLFRQATIEGLATLLKKDDTAVEIWSPLTVLQPKGDRLPFFCVHGITGDVLWFAELAQILAPDQPFYGLQARGLDGVEHPFENIELMAAYYIEQIRLVQPHGPYYLGGASFGGNVAYEMAQQLRSQGDEVGLLVMFDNGPANLPDDLHSNSESRLKSAAKFLGNVPYRLNDLVKRRPDELLARLQREIRVWRKETSNTLSPSEQPDTPLAAADILDYADQLPEYRRRLIEKHYLALEDYWPKPYNGPVVVFKAKGRPLFSLDDPAEGWQKLVTGDLNVIVVPGSHEGMFKSPHVETLAKALSAQLVEAQDK